MEASIVKAEGKIEALDPDISYAAQALRELYAQYPAATGAAKVEIKKEIDYWREKDAALQKEKASWQQEKLLYLQRLGQLGGNTPQHTGSHFTHLDLRSNDSYFFLYFSLSPLLSSPLLSSPLPSILSFEYLCFCMLLRDSPETFALHVLCSRHPHFSLAAYFSASAFSGGANASANLLSDSSALGTFPVFALAIHAVHILFV
jgi:hypothetical protein